MAYFAQLDRTNKVIGVYAVNDDVAVNETSGIEFLTQLLGGNGWFKQTYIDGSSRKNYAGIDYSYDANKDAFIAMQPYPSWTLNEDTCIWDSPVAYPEDGKHYTWDESNKEWVWVSD
mgnify:CR=1 FL=1|tara:strand:+ start:99 stop:449 length:351 start_codon:yes stop_codon:yes gene_type:complete